MTPEKIPVIAQRRFETTARNPLAVNLTSPTVAQGLMQILFRQGQQMDVLERKLDALITRSPHEMTFAPAPSRSKALLAADLDEPQAATTDLATNPKRRIKRSMLLDLFD